MSDFPSPSLVAEIHNLVLRTFDVTPQEAHEYASGLAALAEGWGGASQAAKLDWRHRVMKDLGEKLRWRSETERENFRGAQELRWKAYDAFIQKKGRS